MGLKKLKEKKWFQTLMGIAPTVATALGGPFAGLAMNVVKSATGLESEEALETALMGGNPESLLALRNADSAFKLQMKELGIKEEQLVYDDISDARARQIAMKDHTPAILTAVALTFFFALAASVLYNLEIVREQESFIMFLFGAASGWVTQGMGYFLGSSKGSQRKTDILANGNG